MENGSEFGKGYSYCLGLFLAHAERRILWLDKNDYSLWFNGAGDHLFEFEAVSEQAKAFKSRVLHLRLEKATEEDFIWAIREAKDLLMQFDKENGYEVIKGDYE